MKPVANADNQSFFIAAKVKEHQCFFQVDPLFSDALQDILAVV